MGQYLSLWRGKTPAPILSLEIIPEEFHLTPDIYVPNKCGVTQITATEQVTAIPFIVKVLGY